MEHCDAGRRDTPPRRARLIPALEFDSIDIKELNENFNGGTMRDQLIGATPVELPMPYHLPGYADYIKATASDPKCTERQRVTRFQARRAFARDFESLTLSGKHDSRTITGYEALLRVTLSYSAVDQLIHIIPSLRGKPLQDMDLAESLREVLDLDSIRSDENTSRTDFSGMHSTDDILFFGRVLRHMFAHGSGTPWGVKVQTARGVKVLNDLSTRMLKEADRQFEDWATQRCADLGKQTA